MLKVLSDGGDDSGVNENDDKEAADEVMNSSHAASSLLRSVVAVVS